MADERTYGFSRADAGDLLNMIGSGVGEFNEEWPGIGGGGGGGSYLVRFQATGGWVATAVDADFYAMDGGFIESGTLRDPEGLFDDLSVGDRGLAVFQGDAYWAVKGPVAIGRVVVFTLTGGFVGTSASASFAEVDGTPIGSGSLRDPTSIVGSDLTVGDTGLAYKKGDQYVFLNAACDQDED